MGGRAGGALEGGGGRAGGGALGEGRAGGALGRRAGGALGGRGARWARWGGGRARALRVGRAGGEGVLGARWGGGARWGQVNCTTCGQLSPLNQRLLKDQQRNYIKQRSNLLKKMGLSTHITAEVLASVGTSNLREEDRISIVRGLNSPDSAVIQEGRKKLKSALKNGYHSLIDCYELDFCNTE